MTTLEKMLNFYKSKNEKETFKYQVQYNFLKDKNFDIFTLLELKPSEVFEIIIHILSRGCYILEPKDEVILNKINEYNFKEIEETVNFFYEKVKNIDDLKLKDKYDINNLKNLGIYDAIRILFGNEKEDIDFDLYNYFLENFFSDESCLDALKTIALFMNVKGLLKFMNKRSEKISFLQKNFSFISDLSSKFNQLKTELKNQFKTFTFIKKERQSILDKALLSVKNEMPINIEPFEKYFENYLRFLSQILIYNNELNNKKYENLKQIYDLTQENSDEIEELIIKFDLPLNKESIKIEYNTLEEKLTFITRNYPNIKHTNILLILINDIDLESLIKLSEFITEDFIFNNYEKLKNKDFLNNLLINIKLLKESGIDINTLIKKQKYNNILFFNNVTLFKIITNLKNYNFDLSQNLYKYEFLLHDYSFMIDKFIELGEYDLIKNNFQIILGTDDLIYKRCIINKMLGYKCIDDKNKIQNNLRSEKNFIICDEDLNNLVLENYNVFIPEEILSVLKSNEFFIASEEVDLSLLEDYLKNDYYYKIGNLIISKNKIVRLMNILLYYFKDSFSYKDLLLYAMIYNQPKIIEREDIEQLKKVLNSKTKKYNLK